LSSKNNLPRSGIFFLCLAAAVIAGPTLDAANALYSRGKLKLSIRLFKKALTEGENPVLCYYNCANAYFQLDSLPRALTYYRQCIRMAPDFIKARLNLSIVYYMLEDLGPCIAQAKQTLRMDPNNQRLRLVLAAAYAKSGAIPEAAAEYEHIAGKRPDMTETYLALGEIYRNLEDFETAIQWLSEYPPSGQNYPYVLLLIADIYDQDGDLTRALYFLQKASELDKKNRNIVYRIVQTQKRMGNELVALETAMEAMTQFPKFSSLALEAGNIAFNQGILEKAEYCYSKAYDLGSPGAVVGLENVKIIRSQRALGMPDAGGE
jgi:tetratricopeptide (TPR) repeat protein